LLRHALIVAFLFLGSLWAEGMGRFLMLGYQKSSPAHALYPQTAADRNIPNPNQLRGLGAAADDFWYSSMRKPPHPSCATISEEKPSRIQMTGKEKGASSRDAYLIGI
jgi:hypothetical protein